MSEEFVTGDAISNLFHPIKSASNPNYRRHVFDLFHSTMTNLSVATIDNFQKFEFLAPSVQDLSKEERIAIYERAKKFHDAIYVYAASLFDSAPKKDFYYSAQEASQSISDLYTLINHDTREGKVWGNVIFNVLKILNLPTETLARRESAPDYYIYTFQDTGGGAFRYAA